ncbi:Hypothetical protein, predicted transmembrane protein [Ureaplasma diversum NCTC 246]|uniref:Uncharacterized protein n=1 Tax=Ureaplasma diversum NCTC 246 TaxID=1188241 RepID=A0A084F1D1_9BACT|nr:Hypothetical protein, predicted transmembrane protein [Ureaplasma diversum NCTC 246]
MSSLGYVVSELFNGAAASDKVALEGKWGELTEISQSDVSASGISIAIAVFSVIGTLVIGFSALPQTIKTLKDRDTVTVNFALFFITGVATVFLTIYGIGLVAVNPNSAAFLIQNGESYLMTKSGEYVLNNSEWVAGYLIPGIFLIFCEFLCATTSFIVAFLKLSNMKKAKQNGMSEADYYEKIVKPSLNLKTKGAN